MLPTKLITNLGALISRPGAKTGVREKAVLSKPTRKGKVKSTWCFHPLTNVGFMSDQREGHTRMRKAAEAKVNLGGPFAKRVPYWLLKYRHKKEAP